MKLHRFNATNTRGEVVKEYQVCAKTIDGARDVVREKIKLRFPDTYKTITVVHAGEFSTLSHKH